MAHSSGSAPVAVVSERVARQLWPDKNPIGQTLDWNGARQHEVIGVVNDIRGAGGVGSRGGGRDREPAAAVYFSLTQLPQNTLSVLVRTAGDPSVGASMIARAAQDIDPAQPVYQPRRLDEWLDESNAEPRVTTISSAVFAIVALLLAAVGVYGVLSYSVAQRTQEIGVRMAIGAERAQIIRLVLRGGMAWALTGIALGLAGAFALSRVLGTLLFEVTARDPMTYSSVAPGCVVHAMIGAVIVPGRCALLALAGHVAVTAAAQPAFKGGVNLVTIPAVVTTKDGSRIGDLGPADFRLREDGIPQDVAVVNRDPRPLSVCILLDSSPSMAGRETQAMSAINTMLAKLKDDDQVAMLMFSAKVKVALPWARAREAREFSWYGWRLSLGTALLDAMKDALALVDKADNPLPVIVIVSDGGEMSSSLRLATLVQTRRQSETIVYALRPERPPSKTATPLTRQFAVDFLPDLVGDSGGRVYRATDPASAQAAALALLDELRSQYTLGFAPKKAWDGKYRRIEIEMTNPALSVRYRTGYLAHP